MTQFNSTPPRPIHILTLDGLRALAIVFVAFSHFRTVFGPEGPYHARHISDGFFKSLEFGWFGVDLFFALSGFLITGILLDAKGKEDFFGRFYWRRALRIFPVYYAFLFVMLGLLPHVLHPNPWADLNPLWYISYLVNWKDNHGSTDKLIGQAWSLAVEEQFYMVWPLVVFFSSRRALKWICGGLAATALIVRIAMSMADADLSAIVRVTPARMDPLLLGALMAIAFREPAMRAVLARRAKPVMIACSLLMAGLIITTGSADFDTVPMHTVGMSVLAILFSLMVYSAAALTSGSGFWYRLLTTQTLRSIGKYSYTMYLIHIPLHRILYVPVRARLMGRPDAVVWGVNFAYLIAISLITYWTAWLSWKYFESRLLAFKDNYPWAAAKRDNARYAVSEV